MFAVWNTYNSNQPPYLPCGMQMIWMKWEKCREKFANESHSIKSCTIIRMKRTIKPTDYNYKLQWHTTYATRRWRRRRREGKTFNIMTKQKKILYKFHYSLCNPPFFRSLRPRHVWARACISIRNRKHNANIQEHMRPNGTIWNLCGTAWELVFIFNLFDVSLSHTCIKLGLVCTSVIQYCNFQQ